MSPCDRNRSLFTYQPAYDGSEVIRERDGRRETALFFFFFNRLEKRPLRYFFTDSKESEVEQTPGDREGQESLACCSP